MQKEITYRSKKYMDFVKTLDCCVDDGGYGDIVPHHGQTGGVGLKGNDLSCIPLRASLHDELHQQGKGTFEKKYSIDLQRAIQQTNWAYIEMLEGKK